MNLFPRQPGPTRKYIVKWRARAHRILDRVKFGEDVDPALIKWALRITGDNA